MGMPELAGFCGDGIVDMMVLEGWIVLLRLSWHLHDLEMAKNYAEVWDAGEHF